MKSLAALLALQAYDAALKIDATDMPAIASPWYWLGQLYEKQNRKTDAKAAHTNALKLSPKSKQVSEALKRVS